jgi:hypothetical protein
MNMPSSALNRLVLLILLVLGQSCEIASDPGEISFSLVEKAQVNEDNLSKQISIVQNEFLPLCSGCHLVDSDEFATSIIHRPDYLKKYIVAAKTPIDNWIIKKVSPGARHDGGILCSSALDYECAALTVAWIETFREKEVLALNDLESFTITEGEQLYFFDSYPLTLMSLSKIVTSPGTYGLEGEEVVVRVKKYKARVYSRSFSGTLLSE